MSHCHCDACVLISCSSTPDTCPVEVCPNGCKTSLHRCKTEEHVLHTCPASYVPCINSSFGCEAVLPRARLGSHLRHCPASVIQCRFSYDRTASETPSVVSEESELVVDEESLLADGALARQDGRLLDTSDEGASQPPLFDIDCDTGCDLINPSSRSTAKKLTPSPRTRVCIAATVPQYNYNSKPTKRHYFCFPCNEIVRRDEFSGHWSDCHIRVQASMSTIIQRCPMRVFGCTHRQIRMAPNPSGASLRYLQGADCVALKRPEYVLGGDLSETVPGVYAQQIQKKQELAHYGYGEEEESYDVLSQLPVEILMEICGYLDSLGLWNLSLVNHHIRTVCFNLVKKKGIVYHNWQRNKDTGKWEQGKKVSHTAKSPKAECMYIQCREVSHLWTLFPKEWLCVYIHIYAQLPLHLLVFSLFPSPTALVIL